MVAAVVVLAVLTTACSGDGARLSTKAFMTRANAECATLAAASEELGLAQAEGAAGDEVRGYVEGAADGVRDLAGSLADLRPPDAFTRDNEALSVALERYADGLDEIASRVEPGQGLTEVLEAAPELVSRLNRLADRSTQLVVALGLDGCQLAG